MRNNKTIKENNEEIFHIPSLAFVNGNWNTLVQFLEYEGFPKWSFGGDLDFRRFHNSIVPKYIEDITSLYNLVHIDGSLDLSGSRKLKSIGSLKYVGRFLDLAETAVTSLDELEHVGSNLWIEDTEISSFGKLKYVGEDLYLQNTPLSKKYTEEEIRNQIDVIGKIIKR